MGIAENICSYKSLVDAQENSNDAMLGLTVELVNRHTEQQQIDFYEMESDTQTFITLLYPFNIIEDSYIKISKDITPTKQLLKKILNSIFIINAIGFLLVIIYAIIFSKMLIAPIKGLNKRLSNMNEHMIRPLVVQELPDEFVSLGESINHLINRIQNFVKYQKELFIGAAHELKTPLAVMKLKNQVTLIKKRDPDEYIDAARENLHVAYQHTSHGTHVSYGMFGLPDYKDGDQSRFAIRNNNHQSGKLDFRDYAMASYAASG
mgnify:CR=1 FL=1